MKKKILMLILISILMMPTTVVCAGNEGSGYCKDPDTGKVCKTHYNEYWFALGAGEDRFNDDEDNDSSNGIRFVDTNGATTSNFNDVGFVSFNGTIPDNAVIVLNRENNEDIGYDLTRNASNYNFFDLSKFACTRQDYANGNSNTTCDIDDYNVDRNFVNPMFFISENFENEYFNYMDLSLNQQSALKTEVNNSLRKVPTTFQIRIVGNSIKFKIQRTINITGADYTGLSNNSIGVGMFKYYQSVGTMPTYVANNSGRATNDNMLLVYPAGYGIEYYDPDTDCETTSDVPGDVEDEGNVDNGENDTQSYTITYSANGGNNAPAQQIKNKGTSINISKDTPTRDKYTFLGWSEDINAKEGDSKYAPGSTYNEERNLVLYAVWTPKSGLGYSIAIISSIIVLTGLGVWYFSKRNKFQNV